MLWNEYLLPANFRRLSIKFYSSGVNFVALVQTDYKLWQSKYKKVGNFYALTWLIFAGLVTKFIVLLSAKMSLFFSTLNYYCTGVYISTGMYKTIWAWKNQITCLVQHSILAAKGFLVMLILHSKFTIYGMLSM